MQTLDVICGVCHWLERLYPRMHDAATHSWLKCAGLNLRLAIRTRKAHVVVVRVSPLEADHFQRYTSAPMLH